MSIHIVISHLPAARRYVALDESGALGEKERIVCQSEYTDEGDRQAKLEELYIYVKGYCAGMLDARRFFQNVTFSSVVREA
jgi:hypothetical protein